MLKNILQKFVTLFASDWIKFIGEPKRGQETDNKHRQAATVADFRKPEDNPIPGNLVLYLHICHVGGEHWMVCICARVYLWASNYVGNICVRFLSRFPGLKSFGPVPK